MGSPLTTDKFRIEIPSLSRVQRSIVRSEPKNCEISEDGANNKRKSDFVDLDSCDMTLKELQERSKKKKKLLKSAEFREKNISTGSCLDIKRDYDNVNIMEEESDLDEPLSFWKRKVSSNSKAKRKSTRRQVCSSLESGVLVEAITEQIHSDSDASLSSMKEEHNPANLRFKILRPDSSDCQKLECSFANVSAPEALATKDVLREFPVEMPKSVSGSDMENAKPNSSSKESPSCVVNRVSFECMNLCEPMPSCLSETTNYGDTRHAGFSQTIIESLPFSLSKLIKEGNITNHITNHNSGEANSATQDLCSDIRESSNSYSFQSQASYQMDCDAAIQLPDMAFDDRFQSKELSAGGSSFSNGNGEVDSNEDTPTYLKDDITGNFGSLHISSIDIYPSSNPRTAPDSVHDESPLAENHPVCVAVRPISPGADGAVESLPMTAPNASDGFDVQSQNGAQPDSLPRRLLSNRKAISPTSQEKLRHAVDVEELYERGGNARSRVEGAKVSLNQFCEKPKKNSIKPSQSVPKGILKASHVSVGSPNDGIESSSIPTRAQKAVAFSQRQMQDIESLAMKLVKELKSLKDIVEESLCSKEHSFTPPKYTDDEMRIAIQNAAEVEETTKRWLSMMGRDCNRFCKIMSQRSSGKTTAAERKKITFADEAGGMLCHVKILEDSQDPVFVPESDNVG